MAAKKSPRKTTSGKKTAAAKSSPKKKVAAKKAGPKKKTAARKKTATKKAATKKAAIKKVATKKAVPKKKAAVRSAPERVAKKSSPPTKPAKKAREKREISSMSVNLGQIFALRPRVNTSFPPAKLLTARHLLQDDDFASLEEAVRAVAEKALELTHRGSTMKGPKRGR